MKLSRYRRDHTLRINMTPLIDIVFLLIIFFMTVSQITRIRDLPLRLPTVGGGTSLSQETHVTINVTEDEKVFISGKERSEEEVVSLLANLLAQHGNDPQRVRIEVRHDLRPRSATLNGLVRRLTELGFTQIIPTVSTDN